MSPTYFIGIDPAQVMGVCVWNPNEHLAYVDHYKGTPVEQWKYLQPIISYYGRNMELVFVLERLHNFRNATTTRSLLERIGYFKYSLIAMGQRVEEVSPEPARHWFGVKEKAEVREKMQERATGEEQFTTDETDAALMAICQSFNEDWPVNYRELWIEKKKGLIP